MEIAKNNEILINKIKEALNINELKIVFEKIKESSYINYNYDIDKIEIYLNKGNLDEKTDLDNLKILLIELLDKNMLYINYSEIDDENNKVSDEDKKVNKEFYKV
jgi:adenine-specific DNA-methyltransferase